MAVWRALHEPKPSDVQMFSGIIISGSAACVTAPEPWMDGLADLILDASVAGVPVLGICFGHQMVAEIPTPIVSFGVARQALAVFTLTMV